MAGAVPRADRADRSEVVPAADRDRQGLALLVQFGSFVLLLGIPDGALGVLWPSMRETFGLPLDALGVLTIAATALYFAGGLVGDRVTRRLDVGWTMLVCCIVGLVALAMWGLSPAWGYVLAGVALLGLSRGVVDAVLNAEAALDGGVRRLGFLHAAWAVGGTLGPILVAAAVAAAGNWRVALAVLAVGVAILTPLAALDRHRTGAVTRLEAAGIDTPAAPVAESDESATVLSSGERRFRLGLIVAANAVYVAAEGGLVVWGYSYLLLYRHLSHFTSALAMAAFWAALTLGRFALAIVDDRVSGPAILEWSCILLVAGTATLWLVPGDAAIAGLPLAGLGCAAVFPLLIALTPDRLGPSFTSRAVGGQIAASAIGGPLAVAVFGLLAAHFGVGVLAPCFLGAAAATYVVNRVLTTVTRKVAV